jgi:hypothetical protein
MNMKALVGLATLLFATSAFAQSAQPKGLAKALALAKPRAPIGCKLVGTVKGTKLWAGDCTDAAGLRGAQPTAETTSPPLPEQAGAAIPPGQKQ